MRLHGVANPYEKLKVFKHVDTRTHIYVKNNTSWCLKFSDFAVEKMSLVIQAITRGHSLSKDQLHAFIK
jgi:hypothetical protein